MSFIFNDYGFAAVYGAGFLLSFWSRLDHWVVARSTTRMALLVSVLSPLIMGMTTHSWPSALATVMGLLVALLGWVIVDYASRYLDGDAGQPRFVRALLFTLFSVALLVKSGNLLLMVLSWSASSFGLHCLLTHYQERKAAKIVAHKKFIVSRMADVCLIVALFLVYQSLGGFSLPTINQQFAGMTALPPALSVAAWLFALAAILRTAQLPLHGWLIQVMEAPTPVSALLHAGIVNMGGFVLISLAALINLAPLAQTLLGVIGSMTALLAGWVMMTRISIKVRLAWSTCAQMGFMLMEIGLGLYELALLHLVAHSVYKAYSFLSAGDVVAHSVHNEYLPQTGTIKGPVQSVLLCGGLVLALLMLWQWWLPALSLPVPVMLILILGFSPLLWRSVDSSRFSVVVGALRVGILFHLYLLWHSLFAQLAPANGPTSPILLAFVCGVFVLLYTGQVVIRRYPHTRVVKRCYPWVYNGFYLDETVTRLTFKVWPLKLSTEQAQTLVNRKATTFGELL